MLNRIAYATSIGLAVFSGSVATYGLTKFCPGAFTTVIVMGALFEAGKLTSFALIHRKQMPAAFRIGLWVLGSFLVALNIVGVSGQLSSSYVHRQIESNITAHNAQAAAARDLADLEHQLAAIDTTIAQATDAKIKAHDDQGRRKAADAILRQAKPDRDALAAKLADARTAKAKSEGEEMSAAGEFAAVAYIATLTGASMDRVANLIILVISAIPDLLAVLLLVAAGHKPARKVKVIRKRTRRPRKPAPIAPAPVALRVVA